ncbi:ABC transporter permease [Cohnella massiliensis]|uniref:ABC transporter permease n=1 Tax=Cohnella massiliensis TaxID=1816691 RepID=UPI0009BBBFF0|nr:ABC transporter permease [Cohnella massiliensis]
MSYYVRRFFTLLLTVVLVLLLTFAVFRVIPGNPALAILGVEASPAQIELLSEKLGTDRPIAVQLVDWFRGAATFDLGTSLRFDEPVAGLIAARLPITLTLALEAIAIIVIVSIPLGILAARRRGKAADLLVSAGTQLGLAVPSFWMGFLLILLFGLTLRWVPVSTYVDWSDSPLLALRSTILPAVALAIPQIAIVVRYLRTTLLEQLSLEYVRTARSKGLGERAVLYGHVLRNALLPVVTVIGIQFGELLAGSLVVEQVFTLPGFGSLLITAIGNRDYPLIQGLVLFIATSVIAINFLVDLSYRWLDPKIKLR